MLNANSVHDLRVALARATGGGHPTPSQSLPRATNPALETTQFNRHPIRSFLSFFFSSWKFVRLTTSSMRICFEAKCAFEMRFQGGSYGS